MTSLLGEFDLDSSPARRRTIVADLLRYRNVVFEMARADFRMRYKRAVFGLMWAVLVPLVQAAVIAAVFSQLISLRPGANSNYGVFVLGGVLPWSYFSMTLGVGSTAIVDGADLTQKLWFPRAMLPIVPALANLVGLAVSVVALVGVAMLFGAPLGPQLLVLGPACFLLIAFTMALCLVLSALHTYFRDVRYMVSAALLVWFYASPVIYPAYVIKRYRGVLDLNPLTGVLDLFRMAMGDTDPTTGRAVLVTVLVIVILVAIAIEFYRRHDRLFVDSL
jgi:ABC-type polysaccharide/polyol phosphate export permease